jgi:monoamine oxidase
MALGMGLPFLSTLALDGCRKQDILQPPFRTDFTGSVIVVGAGAAGLTAAYWLRRYGVDVRVLEAASGFGGRVRRADGFADFPLDIGAEWIHTDPSVLARILGDPDLDAAVDIIAYNPQTISFWNGEVLKPHNYLRHLYSEWKFKRSTWYGYLEQYLVPAVADRLLFDRPVTAIEHGSDPVRVTTAGGEVFEADKVLVTVPVSMLQREAVAFSPALPAAKRDAIDGIFMGDGIKIFVEFRERFYPDLVGFGGVVEALTAEDQFVYDAAFRKDSPLHVLGLFAINEPAARYTALPSGEAIIAQFLADLDTMFDGQASRHYRRHVIQNWSAEPFIRGSYSTTFNGSRRRMVDALAEPLGERVHFAGEALSFDHQSTVHGACLSAMDAVQRLLHPG